MEQGHPVMLEATTPMGHPSGPGELLAAGEPPAPTFILWQLPAQTQTQMMSYVIQTARTRIALDARVMVLDGGNAGDAAYLKGFLAALGGEVEAWFITHSHLDHVDAITEILSQPGDLAVRAIYASLPDLEWISRYGGEEEIDAPTRLDAALREGGIPVVELRAGEDLCIGGVQIEVLRVWNPGIQVNALNNSSIVLRMSDGRKSVLFTGDLGVEGGLEILSSPLRDRLRADYCQMAHHGQNGVSREFYQAVTPVHCLWPTPGWLWDNDTGDGKGTGPFRTLEVRAWMEELGVRSHYVMAEGLHRIE
ncbi:MAG: MBL fold metallo-hydrolase [Armatimonadetes bacterium]|nr:MBL fold metallo-hydrolase [Armatimonadota bacterium]